MGEGRAEPRTAYAVLYAPIRSVAEQECSVVEDFEKIRRSQASNYCLLMIPFLINHPHPINPNKINN